MAEMEKKGQTGINMIIPGVLTLALAAIILIFALMMTQGLFDSSTVKHAYTSRVKNETIVTVTEVAHNIAHRGDCGFIMVSGAVVINATTNKLIPSTNYTLDLTQGTIYYNGPVNEQGFNNSNWNISYSYKYGTTSCTATNKTMIGLGKFGDYWDLMVLAIIITVIISLLLIVFAGRKVQ